MEAQTVEQLAGSDYEPLRDTALVLPEQARMIEIHDDDELEFANEWCKQTVLARIDAIKDFFRGRKARAKAVHQDFCDLERAALEPCEKARLIIDRSVLSYNERKEAERRQAEEKARRQQAAAEYTAALHLGITRTAIAISYVAECMERDANRTEVAKLAESAGDGEVATALRAELGQHEPPPQPELPMPAITAPLPASAPVRSLGGASVKKNWKAKTADKMALVRFVAQHPEHEGLLDVNDGAATKLAKAYEARLSQVIPGLEAYNDPNVMRRR